MFNFRSGFKALCGLGLTAALLGGCESGAQERHVFVPPPFDASKAPSLAAGDGFAAASLGYGDALGKRVFVEEQPAYARKYSLSDIVAAEVPTE